MPRSMLPTFALAAGLALAPLASSAAAQDAKPAAAPPPAATRPALNVGDPAPPLAVQRWLKGERVNAFEPGTVYVVEFWATWCGPCRPAMADLTALQARYPQVVCVGVSIWEDDPAAVDPFVGQNAEEMGFRVAADAPRVDGKWGPVAEAWMRAAGQRGIPCWFIVGKDGRIGAINAGALHEILPAVLDGTFDPRARAEQLDKIQAIWPRVEEAFRAKDWPAALRALDELEGVAGPGRYDHVRMTVMLDQGDVAGAAATFARLEAAAARPDAPPSVRTRLERDRLDLLAAQRDREGVNRQLAALAKRFDDDPLELNSLAWQCVEGPADAGLRALGVDTGLALQIAERAVAASEGKDGAILDTLARVHAVRGAFDKAVEIQTQALAADRDGQHRQTFESALTRYRAGRVD